MSEFVGLIQQYLDRHGSRWAAFARNVGVASQTVSKWKTNPGMFPEPDHLKCVAEVTGVPYLIVLDAVLKDAGYRDSTVDDLRALKVRIARYARASRRGAEELREFLEDRTYPDDAVLDALQPEMTTAELNDVIDKMIADADAHQCGNDELFDREFLLDYLGDQLPPHDREQEQSQSQSSDDPEGGSTLDGLEAHTSEMNIQGGDYRSQKGR